jgi:hypothetical protein
MRVHSFGRVIVLLAVLATLLSCGDKETPEQRVARLRSMHEIFPVGATTIRAEGEEPTLLIDVQLANQGTEPLGQLTVLVRVSGGDGSEKLSERVALDLADVRPGIGVRRTAKVPGYELAEDDEVYVEIEANLPPEDLRTLPEFAEMESTS